MVSKILAMISILSGLVTTTKGEIMQQVCDDLQGAIITTIAEEGYENNGLLYYCKTNDNNYNVVCNLSVKVDDEWVHKRTCDTLAFSEWTNLALKLKTGKTKCNFDIDYFLNY